MIEHKSIISCLFSNFNIIIGLITLNNVAIIVGILSGVSVIASNLFSIWLKNKEFKKNNKDVDRTTK